MDISFQRNLAIKLFEDSSLRINFYDFDEIESSTDVTAICAFLESYSTRYKVSVFSTDFANAIFEKNYSFTSILMKEIRGLSPGDFERISAIVCKCLGYSEFYGTKGSHDEGIDFIASSDFNGINIGFKNYVLGQCKHFQNNLVGTDEIRGLAGSAILFSRKEFSTFNTKYKQFSLNTFSHLNVYFMTSYFYSNDSIKLCKNTDIINLDIIDICCLCIEGIVSGKLNWCDSNSNFIKGNFQHDINQINIVN